VLNAQVLEAHADSLGCLPVPAPYVHRLRVRYSECDRQGVVFNGHYLFLYDVALTEWFREAIGPYDEMVAAGTDLVVAESRLRYLSGARFDEELDIELGPLRIGTTSLTVAPRFRVGERTCVEGEVRHVFVDPATGSKREIPKEIRSALERYAPPVTDATA
jgi:acyl-CoA thioester hydrolase